MRRVILSSMASPVLPYFFTSHSFGDFIYQHLTSLQLACVMSYSDSAVGIATCYGLDGLGIESLVAAIFSAPVQTGPGAHPASYTMSTGSFPGIKRSGRGVDHPPPSSAEVEEKIELYICSFWAFVACYRLNFALLHVLFINYILATLPESKDSIPGGGKRFFLLKNVHTGSGAHLAFC